MLKKINQSINIQLQAYLIKLYIYIYKYEYFSNITTQISILIKQI